MADHARGFQVIFPPRRIRFGSFEADSRSGELRKNGIKVRIGQQTFQILMMLLDHPGEVVLREEIRLNLWPHDTVVEFDHSINAAIQKLREALGESAGDPRYIETLPRRGYRFIGTVEIPEAPERLEPAPAPDAAATETRHPRWSFAIAAAALLIALLVLAATRLWVTRTPLKSSDIHSWTSGTTSGCFSRWIGRDLHRPARAGLSSHRFDRGDAGVHARKVDGQTGVVAGRKPACIAHPRRAGSGAASQRRSRDGLAQNDAHARIHAGAGRQHP